MQKLTKLFYLFVLYLFMSFQSVLGYAGGSNLENNITTAINSYNFPHNKEKMFMKCFWKKIVKNGHSSLEGKDADLRPTIVTLQEIIESNIVDALEKGNIARVVGVIHTPTPPTPLRIKDPSNLSDIAPEAYRNNPQVLETLINRHHIMLKLLELKGTLITAYPKNLSKFKTQGYKHFLSLCRTYTNLIDKPIKHHSPELTGATYLIKYKNGTVKAFSLHSTQINSLVEGTQKWEIWFGDIKNKNVAKRIVKIDSFLKAEDIDIYHYLQ